ncbi:MAG: FAD binding domain-containing protein [Anaerolineae bacterium]|nr:FAD binding domain-containing protein [Anaerolineae bacterium]
MPPIRAYYRPSTLAEALQLLARSGITTAVLAGGTYLNAHAEGVDEVVDLQALGLEGVAVADGRLHLGTMTRVQTLVETAAAPTVLRQVAHREGPNTFRHQGTIGGVIVRADPESELLAALLVFEAEVTVQNMAGSRTLSLADFLADVPAALAGGILTAVSVATTGAAAAERVARTPADSPIVAALGRKTPDGRLLLALCGVAKTPVLVAPERLNDLDPPADFRGSSEYRRAMAILLSERVLARLTAAAP